MTKNNWKTATIALGFLALLFASSGTFAKESTVSDWQPGQYPHGEVVLFNDNHFVSLFPVNGEPGSTHGWALIRNFDNPPNWKYRRLYSPGDAVIYQGQLYVAIFWSWGQYPDFASQMEYGEWVKVNIPDNANLTGTWEGSYTWDCGSGLTGESEITVNINEDESGTLTYLNGSIEIEELVRFSEVTENEFGFIWGTTDPDGKFVLIQHAGSPGNFVLNSFSLVLDENTLSGTALNGNSPASGSAGCSAVDGSSGTIELLRTQ